ncbi:MAG: DUF2855 family protein, partial [Oceanicaulis sp.]
AANIRVGGAHWEHSAPARSLPGPRPAFFFAPVHVKKRAEEWGPQAFAARYAEAWRAYLPAAGRLFDAREMDGPEAALAAWRALVDGSAPGREALTVSV